MRNSCFLLLFLSCFILENSSTLAQCKNTVNSSIALTAPNRTEYSNPSNPNYTSTINKQYYKLKSVVKDRIYRVTNSKESYITITQSSANGTVVAHGYAPLEFTAPANDTYYIHVNVSSTCASGGAYDNTGALVINCLSCSGSYPPPNDLCKNAAPFCVLNGESLDYTLHINDGSASDNSSLPLGCLQYGKSNPSWFYIETTSVGTIDFDIKAKKIGASGVGDVQVALWGPFSDVSAAKTACKSSSSNPIVCDADYNFSGPETTHLNSSVDANKVYLMLIINQTNDYTTLKVKARTTNTVTTNYKNTALPIELTSFSGFAINEGNQLHWQTATEKNNAYFELESTVDGINYNHIGTIQGAGNSSTVDDYTFLDRYPAGQTTYYRLRQVDFDGESETFNPISIKRELSGNIMVSP